MSEPGAGGLVRRYWPVGIAALAVVAGIAVPLVRQAGGANGDAETQTARSAMAPREVASDRIPEAPQVTRKSPEEQTRALIAEHRQKVEENPRRQDAPVLLLAMGNLYRQKLLDYESAADCYRWLIGDYPNAENITSAYINLGVCYERLGEQGSATRLYREMSENFPEDSVEHQFAQQKLREF